MMVKTVKRNKNLNESSFEGESYDRKSDCADTSPTEEHYGLAYDVDDLPKIAMVHTLDRPVRSSSKRSTVIEIFPGGIFQPGVVVSSKVSGSNDNGIPSNGVATQDEHLYQEQVRPCDFGEDNDKSVLNTFEPDWEIPLVRKNDMSSGEGKRKYFATKTNTVTSRSDFKGAGHSCTRHDTMFGDSRRETVNDKSCRKKRLFPSKDYLRWKGWRHIYKGSTLSKCNFERKCSARAEHEYDDYDCSPKGLAYQDNYGTSWIKREVDNNALPYSKFGYSDYDEESLSFDSSSSDDIGREDAYRI